VIGSADTDCESFSDLIIVIGSENTDYESFGAPRAI
jgi:hypothetical protein